MSTFRKLWGVIDDDIDEGEYTVHFKSNFDVSGWDGQKHVVLATSSRLGGRSFVLPVACIVAGCVCFVSALLLAAVYYRGRCYMVLVSDCCVKDPVQDKQSAYVVKEVNSLLNTPVEIYSH